MGKKILLGVLGVIVGLLVGMVANIAFVIVNFALFAPEGGVDMQDPEAMKSFVANLPATGYILPLVAHGSQAFLGALIGTLIAGRRSLVVAWVIGVLTLIGCVANLINLGGPAWFWAADIVLPLVLCWLGGKLVLKKDAAPA